MKKLLMIVCLLGLASCKPDYQVVSTKVVRGKISAIDDSPRWDDIYIQNPRQVIKVQIGYNDGYQNYKVGDSITLVVQQVEVKK